MLFLKKKITERIIGLIAFDEIKDNIFSGAIMESKGCHVLRLFCAMNLQAYYVTCKQNGANLFNRPCWRPAMFFVDPFYHKGSSFFLHYFPPFHRIARNGETIWAVIFYHDWILSQMGMTFICPINLGWLDFLKDESKRDWNADRPFTTAK